MGRIKVLFRRNAKRLTKIGKTRASEYKTPNGVSIVEILSEHIRLAASKKLGL